MTTATTVRVTCRAQHPDPKKHGQLCGAELPVDFDGPVRFVGLAAKKPTKPDGRLRVKCERATCKTWNIYERVRDE